MTSETDRADDEIEITLPAWCKRRPVLEYDPESTYDMTYKRHMTALLERMFKNAGLTGVHKPEMAFGRLYDENEDYVPIMIAVDSKLMSLKKMMAELKLAYGMSAALIPIPGAEGGEEYLYVSPFYRWEDADFWMSIKDKIGGDENA